MSDGFGMGGWVIAILAVVVGLVVLYAVSRLRKGGGHGREDPALAHPELRLAVLESAMVDAQRRLVLVACDDVEHLLLIGGPADLVVESDVGRQRAVRPAAVSVVERAPEPRPQPSRQEPAAPPEPVTAAPAVAGDLKAAETSRPAKPAEQPARPSSGRPALAAVPASPAPPKINPAPATAAAHPAAARPAAVKPAESGDGRGAQPKAPADPQFGRRDPPSLPAVAQPALPPPPAVPTATPAALPTAQVPWPEGDSLEHEIVKALRTEPNVQAPNTGPAQRRDAAPTAKTAGTTLGDLADRLEEALAREVQAAGPKSSRLDLGLDAFGFDQANGDGPAAEAAKPPGPEGKTKAEPAKGLPAAPEAEGRREPRPYSERQEEAPVISLNARRREPVDPLEDEMARLLGELTGDSGRR